MSNRAGQNVLVRSSRHLLSDPGDLVSKGPQCRHGRPWKVFVREETHFAGQDGGSGSTRSDREISLA